MYPGTTDYTLYDDLFADNPSMWFSTAAGPAEDDMFGPPSASLDVYGDGTPMLLAEQRVANNTGAGMMGVKHDHWWQRGDVHALALTILGYWMIKQHLKD